MPTYPYGILPKQIDESKQEPEKVLTIEERLKKLEDIVNVLAQYIDPQRRWS